MLGPHPKSFWLNETGWGPKILDFEQVSRWRWFCWSGDHTWRTAALTLSLSSNTTALILLTLSLANHGILSVAAPGRHHSQAEKRRLFERSENTVRWHTGIKRTGSHSDFHNIRLLRVDGQCVKRYRTPGEDRRSIHPKSIRPRENSSLLFKYTKNDDQRLSLYVISIS